MPATLPSPAPIRLTDSQLDELMRLSAPLQPHCRDAFLRILAHELRGRADVGDGELFRTAREVIRANRLFDAPDIERVYGAGQVSLTGPSIGTISGKGPFP
jgi:hypothetical protein